MDISSLSVGDSRCLVRTRYSEEDDPVVFEGDQDVFKRRIGEKEERKRAKLDLDQIDLKFETRGCASFFRMKSS